AKGAEWVIVTNGISEVWLTSLAECHRFRPPSVPVVNPIGCGDCLAAGLAVALSEGRDVVESVQFGMAAAAENAPQLLAGRIDRANVDARVRDVVVERGSSA